MISEVTRKRNDTFATLKKIIMKMAATSGIKMAKNSVRLSWALTGASSSRTTVVKF